MRVVANFFERDDVGIELGEISVDGADLAVLFTARSIRATAREPLHIPKRGGDGGRRRMRRGILRGERRGEEDRGEKGGDNSGRHGARTVAAALWAARVR